MANNPVKDFDRFIAEREGAKMQIRIFGRECSIPAELPWHYMMKIERMLKTGQPISGEENAALVKQLLQPDDYEFVTNHPEFRVSYFWRLIAFAYLQPDEPEKPAGPVFKTEDDVRVEKTQAGAAKK